MSRLTRRGMLAAGAGLAASLPAPWGAVAQERLQPDLVLRNGRIWTGSARLAAAQAVAIGGGRILAIGSDDEIAALAPAGTAVVDLGGQRVTPGFNDAHAHPIAAGVNLLRQVALEVTSIDAAIAAIRARAEATPSGGWVMGFLYDDLKTERPITRDDLNAAAPAHPVFVRHRGGHTAFVNSLAFELAGVGEDTPDPEHGQFFRDAAGRLNGRVGEAAIGVFTPLTEYAPAREDYRAGAKLISGILNGAGITSVCDAMGEPATIQGAQDARDAGELSVRLYSHVAARTLDAFIAAGLHTGFGDDMVRLGAVKLTADGSISERTAWVSEPYEGQGSFHGLETISPEELMERARTAHLAGWQLGIHANGDFAIDRVLGVFEALQQEAPKADPRFRIEHCTVVDLGLIERIKAVGGIPVPFAGYVYFHGDKMPFYGQERTKHMFAFREFIDAGVRAASSSDYTASPPIPMMWLQSQVTRTDPDGDVWGENQAISVEEALVCGTINGAWASYEEDIKGSLEPGKLADLVVWDKDLVEIDPGELLSVKPERTMVGGRWVYEA